MVGYSGYSLSSCIVVYSAVLSCVWLPGAWSSAPGDIGTYCSSLSALPSYPDTKKRLMDSWSYQNTSGLWSIIDADNDRKTWMSVMGETCREKLKVNEPLHFPQNNWIVTQFVNKSIPAVYNVNPTTVFVYIDYYLDTSCEPVDCYPNFQLLYRLVNQSDPAIVNDTNGYTLLANVTSYDDTSLHSRTYNFSISPSDNGFYIGIRDIGANITITRLFVYRLIGPQGQLNLTLYPEVPAPSTGHIHVSGTCVANANTTSGYPPVLRLESTGEWRDSDQCYCIEGHQPELIEGSTQCQACPLYTYKSTLSNADCSSCPAHSFSSQHGSSKCTCSAGFYRANYEAPDVPCTGPPTFPKSLTTSTITDTTVLILWEVPESTGGRNDGFYNLYTSKSYNGQRTFIAAIPWNETMYNITSLEPSTLYFIQLVAENGISNQTNNDFQRIARTNAETLNGVAEQVTNVRVIHQMFVEWNILSDADRGPITGYQVNLYSGTSEGRIINIDRDSVLYMVNVTEDFPPLGQPVYVRVRGLTSVGPGQWSDLVLFAEVNPLSPSSLLAPTSTVTMATSSTSQHVMSSSISTMLTSSSTTSSISISSTSISSSISSYTNVPTVSPTTALNNPAISIAAVIGGVVVIIVIVAMGSLAYFVVRRIRLVIQKRRSPQGQDETDSNRQLVRYDQLSKGSGDEEELLNEEEDNFRVNID